MVQASLRSNFNKYAMKPQDKYCENEINQPNFIVVFVTYMAKKV